MASKWAMDKWTALDAIGSVYDHVLHISLDNSIKLYQSARGFVSFVKYLAYSYFILLGLVLHCSVLWFMGLMATTVPKFLMKLMSSRSLRSTFSTDNVKYEFSAVSCCTTNYSNKYLTYLLFFKVEQATTVQNILEQNQTTKFQFFKKEYEYKYIHICK